MAHRACQWIVRRDDDGIDVFSLQNFPMVFKHFDVLRRLTLGLLRIVAFDVSLGFFHSMLGDIAHRDLGDVILGSVFLLTTNMRRYPCQTPTNPAPSQPIIGPVTPTEGAWVWP